MDTTRTAPLRYRQAILLLSALMLSFCALSAVLSAVTNPLVQAETP